MKKCKCPKKCEPLSCDEFRRLIIREAVLFVTSKELLGEDWTIERTRAVENKLRSWEDVLPPYESPKYLLEAKKMYVSQLKINAIEWD